MTALALLVFAFGDPSALQVVRVHPLDAAQVATVVDAAEDVYTHRARPGPVDIAVDDAGLLAIDHAGISYEVVVDDARAMGESLRMSAWDHANAQPAPAPDDPLGDFFSAYRPLEDIEAYITGLAALYPESSELITLEGESIEGRQVHGLRLGSTEPDAPAILVNSVQHAREWIAGASTTCVADTLLRGESSDPQIADLLERATVYVVPIVNPDGYVYTWENERLWRKNRREDYGVDLNRNWGVGWGLEPGSSAEQGDGNYRGTEAFSEPETAQLRDFIIEHPQINAHLDVHSYTQYVLFPWGYEEGAYAEDDLELRGWAIGLADALSGVHGQEYKQLIGWDFYPAAGVMPDWVYGEAGAFSFTVELRPAPGSPYPTGFELPPDQIRPTCEELSAAVLTLGGYVLDGGPEPVDPPPEPEPEETGGEEETEGGEESGTEETGADESTSGFDDEGGETGNGADSALSNGCACRSAPGERGLPAALLFGVLVVAVRFRRLAYN